MGTSSATVRASLLESERSSGASCPGSASHLSWLPPVGAGVTTLVTPSNEGVWKAKAIDALPGVCAEETGSNGSMGRGGSRASSAASTGATSTGAAGMESCVAPIVSDTASASAPDLNGSGGADSPVITRAGGSEIPGAAGARCAFTAGAPNMRASAARPPRGGAGRGAGAAGVLAASGAGSAPASSGGRAAGGVAALARSGASPSVRSATAPTAAGVKREEPLRPSLRRRMIRSIEAPASAAKAITSPIDESSTAIGESSPKSSATARPRTTTGTTTAAARCDGAVGEPATPGPAGARPRSCKSSASRPSAEKSASTVTR